MSLGKKVHAVERVLRLVGDYDGADVFARVLASMDNDVDLATTPEALHLELSIDYASQATANILLPVKVASTLLDALAPVWRGLPMRWLKRRARLQRIWDPVVAEAERLCTTEDKTSPPEEAVTVHIDPANEEVVAALHRMSWQCPALRLMFYRTSTPGLVYTADINDDDVLDAILAPYPVIHFRGYVGEEYMEFRVYELGGYPIVRTPEALASCFKSALDVLQTGEMRPRMASTRTASVIRLTFSLRAMKDPAFRDELREMGGVPASLVSWDVPIYKEEDVQNALDKVRERYPVHIYQIIDTPEQNLFASAEPESQVARLLSAEIVEVLPHTVTQPDMSSVAAKVASVIAHADADGRQVLQKIDAACAIRAHYFVAAAGEVKPQNHKFKCDVPSMFNGLRGEVKHVRVYVMTGSDVTQIVSAEAIDLDANHDGVVDALEVGTMGLLGVDAKKPAKKRTKRAIAEVNMDKKVRDAVNADLRKQGFDGGFRFRTLGQALGRIGTILKHHGFDLAMIVNARELSNPSGHSNFAVEQEPSVDHSPFDPSHPVANTSLAFQWGPFGDTRDYEVIAYLG